MLYDISDPKFRAAVLAFMLARKAAARRADLESEIDRVKRRMEQRRIHAMSQLVLYSCAADESSERRHVQRNSGKWRGSTISGYLRGDDQTYVENFRMNSATFDKLLALLEHTSFATAERCSLVHDAAWMSMRASTAALVYSMYLSRSRCLRSPCVFGSQFVCSSCINLVAAFVGAVHFAAAASFAVSYTAVKRSLAARFT